ncbi:MAG: hypothetical protein IPG71_03460 [bacterium]|nr:hypothetical protein [bacterium]
MILGNGGNILIFADLDGYEDRPRGRYVLEFDLAGNMLSIIPAPVELSQLSPTDFRETEAGLFEFCHDMHVYWFDRNSAIVGIDTISYESHSIHQGWNYYSEIHRTIDGSRYLGDNCYAVWGGTPATRSIRMVRPTLMVH